MASRRDSNYVRPPIVAIEAPTRRASARRFRLIVLVLLIAILVGAVVVAEAILHSGEGNPSVMRPPRLPAVTAQHPVHARYPA